MSTYTHLNACEIKQEQKCNSCVLSAFNLLVIPPNRFLSFARSLVSHRQLIVSGRVFSLCSLMCALHHTHTHKKLSGAFFPLIIFSTALIARVSCSRSRGAKREVNFIYSRRARHTQSLSIFVLVARDPRTHFAAGEAKTDHPQARLAKYKK